MRAILVRIGIDHSFGQWNAPVDLTTGDFLFVPIPDNENTVYPPELATYYDMVQEPIAEFARAHGIAGLHLPEALQNRTMHLAPDFKNLTYGDNGANRGSRIATFSTGDLLVFYAGLRSIASPKELAYGLVGLFVVEEVVRAQNITAKRLHENAHTRWAPVSANDIVVRANPNESGRLDRFVPIGSYREKAYRVLPEIEAAWGGLDVNNGYIQRSAVPPEFNNPEMFLDWFKKQNVTLSRRRF